MSVQTWRMSAVSCLNVRTKSLMYKLRSFTFRTSFVIQCKKLHDYMQRRPWLISSLMHEFLIYLYIIHLLKSFTCFKHYPAHIQEVVPECGNVVRMVSATRSARLQYIITRDSGTGWLSRTTVFVTNILFLLTKCI
jgi:hypothetical protein